MNGLGPLISEAIQDAVRRRLVYVVGAICLMSALGLDSCSSMLPSTIEVNDEPVEMGATVAASAGLVTFVILGLWVITLAGVLAADQLRESLEDGSAALTLARPVSRTTFVLGRLAGVLTVAWAATGFLLGISAYLLSSRHAVPLAPAILAVLACVLSGFTLATWSMAASLVLPRVATTLLVFAVVGMVTITNAIGAAVEIPGIFGLVNEYGPPLASSMIGSLAAWLPEDAAAGLRVDSVETFMRLALWAAGGLGTLLFSIRRIEIGR
jgi:ABC-type transport system involved in multi-copper enzyme maturation permease subunit